MKILYVFYGAICPDFQHSKLSVNIIEFCVFDYLYLLKHTDDLTKEEKVKYINEANEFYSKYIKNNKNIDVEKEAINYLKNLTETSK